MKSAARFDAPFWAVLLSGVVLASALGFLGMAASAQSASHLEMEVLSSDDLPPGGPAALSQAD